MFMCSYNSVKSVVSLSFEVLRVHVMRRWCSLVWSSDNKREYNNLLSSSDIDSVFDLTFFFSHLHDSLMIIVTLKNVAAATSCFGTPRIVYRRIAY